MRRQQLDPQIGLLLRILDEAYEKRAWHGTNLKGSLRGLSPREAAWRPSAGRHNIWELVVHAAYWKYAVWRRLTGQKRRSFPYAGSNWFDRPASPTEKAWRADLSLLEEQNRKLRRAVKELSPSRLHRASAGSRQINATLIYGVACHDIYHTGQIQLLKRLYRQRRTPSRRPRAG